MSTTNRRDFLKQAGAALALGATTQGFGETPQPGNAARRPNVLLIYADDLDFDEIGVYDPIAFPTNTGAYEKGLVESEGWIPHYGDKRMLTPHIDSLARDGAMFTRFYITSPICTPSRYSLMTGRYASRSEKFAEEFPHGGPANIMWNTFLDGRETNLPKALQAGGYTTGLVGKWHLTHYSDPDSGMVRGMPKDADPSEPDVAKKIRDTYTNACEYVGRTYGFDYVDGFWNNNKENMGLPESLQVHNMEWLTQNALDFLEQHGDDPFFLYVATTVPHGSYTSSFLEDNPLATPAGLLDEAPKSQPSRESILERIKAAGIKEERNAMATWLDDGVGAILKKLDDKGLRDNTIVIFISDHQNRGKYTCYEAGRVPCLVRWPGRVKPGLKVDALCANIDVTPTVLDICGVQAPETMQMDGRSFAPLLAGRTPEKPWRESLLLEVAHARAVVTEDWKYIAVRYPPELWEQMKKGNPRDFSWDGKVYRNKRTGELEKRYQAGRDFPAYSDPDQLYNLEKDVYEQHNLAGDPEYAARVLKMQSMLREHLAWLPHSFGEFT